MGKTVYLRGVIVFLGLLEGKTIYILLEMKHSKDKGITRGHKAKPLEALRLVFLQLPL